MRPDETAGGPAARYEATRQRLQTPGRGRSAHDGERGGRERRRWCGIAGDGVGGKRDKAMADGGELCIVQCVERTGQGRAGQGGR